jgi:rfaE bifunctional protein nucleotidyltransferase chain/domain
MLTHKVLSFESASAVLDKVRVDGKRIVQCHGTFDLIHPGHIYHLEEAKDLGDVLVVTVTAEKFVNKGPGRPYFNDQMRSKSLAALACVDYVILIPFAAAVEAIDCVRPDIYCKGTEYVLATNDVTGNIQADVAAVERNGGQTRYLGSVVFSSTKLINNHFDNLPDGVKVFCRQLSSNYGADRLRADVDAFKDIKVLVVGDIIFDRYSYVRVQGMTSKATILSGRFLNEETQPGGALAVFRHVQQFCDNVKLLGLLGTESWVAPYLEQIVPRNSDAIIRDEEFTSIIKQRFVVSRGEGKEIDKLFSVNYIDADPPSDRIQDRVIDVLRKEIENYDVVLVMDFGHGLMQQRIRELVQAKAKFMALNCQTNSNNHGFNIINRQYQRADCFALDEAEMLLACAQRHIDYVEELGKLSTQLKSSVAWLTRGSTETIGRAGNEFSTCLPFEKVVTDTVGAGDAFCSVACLAAYQKLPVAVSTFLGQLAGAQAVRIVGNSQPISKQVLLKSGMSLLNF